MANQNILDIYELSPLQQGMLFHTIKHPDTGVYVVQLSCRLDGALDLPTFRQAWQKVIARHSTLRTAFYWKEADKPLQVVYRQVQLPWNSLDWRDLAPAEQETRLETYLQQDRQAGFTLSQAPLMRVALIRLADQQYRLVWSYHHLLLDGWSLSQLLRELFIYYEIILRDESYPMPPARPYREYITWLQQQNMEAAASYWQTMLADFTAPTPLAIQKRQPHEGELDRIDPAEAQLTLSPQLTTALQALARQHQLTLNTVMQGAWGLLLGRYAGEEDVLFGSVVSGRPTALDGVESMVGPFINTLPVRLRVPSDLATIDWLKALHRQLVEMREYEYSPLVDIQQWSGVPPGQPLFESSFVFENYPLEASLQDERLSLKISDLQDFEQTNFPLGLLVMPGEQLLLKIAYDRQRFEHAAIDRMLDHLACLLTGMVEDIARPLGSLPLLSETEARCLLDQWSQAPAPYKSVATPELFDAQVAHTPDAVAVTFEDQELSYAALNRRANRLAHYLRSVGVGPEVLVGLHMERSLEMIVALLAILKAGGAYLPLDPAYPRSRLALMLEDAGWPLVLTVQSLAEGLADLPVECFSLDGQRLNLARFSTENPAPVVAASNLAYIIYTSGSTGTPKGTLVTHEGINHKIGCQRDTLGIGPGSQVLQFASLNFDGAVWEILPPLCLGATIHLARRETIMAVPALVELLETRRITMATLPPSVLALMSPASLPDLQILVSAGERCTPEIVERWAPGRRLFNGYGPTETTVGLAFAELHDQEALAPIGRPFPNQEIYLLDSQMRPVPIGIPGEIYAGGVGLARGYLHHPALTAERFLPHPFSNEPGARLYRTGDRARYLPDGRLEFLGRVDSQVKIRGFRVEPGEIESLLRRYPGVVETLVMVREEVAGNKQLVAYYRTADEQEIAPGILRDYLRQRLPAYMVPATLMQLEQFPLTPNGKVDRAALPTPHEERSRQGLIPPATELEQAIATIWQELLQVDRVSVDDNFFDLGGHSLLMLQVSRRLQQILQREIPMVDLFQYPTVRSLSHHLEEPRAESALDQVEERTRKQRAALQKQRLQKKKMMKDE